jgi:serine/threonine protein kinase
VAAAHSAKGGRAGGSSVTGGGYEVVKQVPATERVLARLREKFPEADAETLERRARKFTEKIFPVFLTRETAMLRLLARDLPRRFRNRVPRVLDAQTDANGYVRTLRMNWLRNGCPIGKSAGGGNVVGGQPLSQLAFARQAAELLAALHDEANVMHLDLRLDNVVITQNGVGFVDFGSAVRVGENFPEASLLGNLFEEMMRTSQIQRMLGKMSESGQVTSEDICRSYGKIDKAVDFFYLAVQINNPHANPDFRGLVTVDKHSNEARELAALTEKILRPADARNPEFKSARDIYNGILDIERRLGKETA